MQIAGGRGNAGARGCDLRATERFGRVNPCSAAGESGLFAPDVVEMITVGEQANNLDEVLLTVAQTLESRIERMLQVALKPSNRCCSCSWRSSSDSSPRVWCFRFPRWDRRSSSGAAQKVWSYSGRGSELGRESGKLVPVNEQSFGLSGSPGGQGGA